MVIVDIVVMLLRFYKGEEEMYKVVDVCIVEIEKSGFKCEIGVMSIIVEGDFDEVFELLKKVYKIFFNFGCERVIIVVRVDEKVGGLIIDEKFRNYR